MKRLIIIMLLMVPYNVLADLDSLSNYPTALDVITDTCPCDGVAGISSENEDSCWDVTDGTGGSGGTIWGDQFDIHSDAIIKLETKIGPTASTPTSGQVLIGGATAGTSAWQTLSGDAQIASNGTVGVVNDSHTHGSSTLAGIDISSDTNLDGGTNGIDMSGDLINFDPSELTGDMTIADGTNNTIAWAWNLVTGDPSLTFGDGLILIPTTQQLQFRDTAIYLASLNDGYLDIEADTAIRMLGPVDMGANALDCDSNTVTLSTVAGAINAGSATSLEIPNGNSVTVDADGEVAIDTDDERFIVRVNGGNKIFDFSDDAENYVLKSNGSGVFSLAAESGTGGDVTLDAILSPTDSALTTWTFNNGEAIKMTSDLDAASSFLTLENTDADHTVGNVVLLDLSFSADDGDVDADFIKCQDSGGTVFSVQEDGNVTAGTVTAASLSTTEVEDPKVSLVTSDAQDTDWYVGVNADAGASSDDDFEIRTDPTAGTGVALAIDPTTGISSTLNFATTGTILGATNVVITTDGSETATSAQMYGTMFIADNATAANDTTYTLPEVATGMTACFYDNGDGDGGIIIEIDDADIIHLNGTALDAGDTIDSPGVAGTGANGDFICLMAIDNTTIITLGRSGTWVDGGAT